MNRLAKEALKRLDSDCTAKEKAYANAMMFSGHQLDRAMNSLEINGVQNAELIAPICHAKHAVKGLPVQFKGVREQITISQHDFAKGPCRYTPRGVWVPNGKLIAQKNGGLEPLGENVSVTPVLRGYRVTRGWKAVSKAVGVVSEHLEIEANDVGSPYLIKDPALKSEQHVYFIIGWCNDEFVVKIGISSDVSRRVSQVSREYSVEDPNLFTVIAGGGEVIEKSLHERFSHLHCPRAGGREWFYIDEYLSDFLDGLAKAPIKSAFLKEWGLVLD